MIKNINMGVTIVSIILVLAVALSLIISPDTSLGVINTLFGYVSTWFGVPLLWFSVLCVVLCIYIAFSKYGNIRLGEGKAQYSLFSYIGMMICGGLAASSVYFSFIEWIYFYTWPAQGIEAMSVEAMEFAPAYSFTYWGLISWPPFVIAAIPMSLSYYKRHNKGLRLSIVCEDLFNLKANSLIGKIIDVLFVITTLGGLSVTLGLGVPLISYMMSYLFGFQDGFTSQVIIVLVIACVFSLSSYIGLEKGMKKISDTNIYLAIILVFILLVTGSTIFILKYMTNGVALALKEYLSIVLWADPVNNSGFSEAWVIFYICFAVAYAPLMSLFITKISKGRSLKEMVLSTVLGGTAGCIILFGINGGYGAALQVNGTLDVVTLFESGVGPTVIGLLSTVPLPEILTVALVTVMLILFLSTSLDAASFSLSATVMKNIDDNEAPNPMLRLFWCLVLAGIPLGLMFAGASLSAIQTVCLVTATPFAIIIIVFIFKSFKWMKQECGILETPKVEENKEKSK